MKSLQDIEKEIVDTIVSKNSSVTFYGVTGSLRGFITAVSLKIRDLWHELTQLTRKLFYDTSSGPDLDRLVNQIGIARRGATKAGALLLFSGPDSTNIPAGTVIYNPTTNIGYQTKQLIIIGQKNNNLVMSGLMNVTEPLIGDIAWAECLTPGIVGRCAAHSITKTDLADVKVTNPAPSQGGSDQENDDELRYRAKNYVKLLNKNTQKYYESICQDLDERIIRTKAFKDYTKPDSIKITIVTKSAVPFTDAELKNLADKIAELQRTFSSIKCENLPFTLISLTMRVKLKGVNGEPVDFEQYYLDVSDALTKYFDWSKWEFGVPISLDDVFLICEGVPQTDDIELSTFKLNGSNATKILISPNSLPYFQGLEITDITTGTTITISNTNIVQSYQNLTLEE